MKYIIPVFILLVNTVLAQAQQKELKDMLGEINMAVASAPAGQYILTEDYKKVVPGRQPVHSGSVSTCYYKVNSKDNLVGYKISVVRNENTIHKIYNGTAIIEKSDRIVTVTDVRKYPDETKRLLSNESLSPFAVAVNIFLQKYREDSLINKIKLAPDEVINGEKCWVLIPQGNEKEKTSYYISKTTFLPVKVVITSREVVGKVTETTVFTHAMDQLKKVKVPDSVFTISAITDYNSVKEYTGAGPAADTK